VRRATGAGLTDADFQRYLTGNTEPCTGCPLTGPAGELHGPKRPEASEEHQRDQGVSGLLALVAS